MWSNSISHILTTSHTLTCTYIAKTDIFPSFNTTIYIHYVSHSRFEHKGFNHQNTQLRNLCSNCTCLETRQMSPLIPFTFNLKVHQLVAKRTVVLAINQNSLMEYN